MGLGPVLVVVVVVVAAAPAAPVEVGATSTAAAPGTRRNGPLGKYTGWSCPCVREAWGGWSAPACTIGISTTADALCVVCQWGSVARQTAEEGVRRVA